jgi:hypothetical protein
MPSASGFRRADMAADQSWLSAKCLVRISGVTVKNRTRLTALFEEPAYSMLLGLPEHWMDLATDPERDPYEAARMATYAAALEVLSFCRCAGGICCN